MLGSRCNIPGVCRHGTCFQANFKMKLMFEIIVDMSRLDSRKEVSKSIQMEWYRLCDILIYWARSRQAGRYHLPCHLPCRRPAHRGDHEITSETWSWKWWHQWFCWPGMWTYYQWRHHIDSSHYFSLERSIWNSWNFEARSGKQSISCFRKSTKSSVIRGMGVMGVMGVRPR